MNKPLNKPLILKTPKMPGAIINKIRYEAFSRRMAFNDLLLVYLEKGIIKSFIKNEVVDYAKKLNYDFNNLHTKTVYLTEEIEQTIEEDAIKYNIYKSKIFLSYLMIGMETEQKEK